MKDFSTNDAAQPRPRYVFLIGAPRSGTTWLQLLLAQHPDTATTSETHLFTQYFSLLEKRWQHEKERLDEGYKVSGLTQVIDEKIFYRLMRMFADGVLNHARKANPKSTIIVEKTPENTLYPELVHRVYPDAYFLHIIRDPRAVANSFSKAAETWWSWTTSGPVSAAQRWKDNVEKGREFGNLTDRYLEVRYENLVSNGSDELLRIWKWLGVNSDAKQCESAVSACQIDKLRSGSNGVVKPWAIENEPEGFFRKGGVDAWKNESSSSQVAVVEFVAKELMAQLGYTRMTKCGVTGFLRIMAFRIVNRIYKFVKYIGEGAEWRLRRALSKM